MYITLNYHFSKCAFQIISYERYQHARNIISYPRTRLNPKSNRTHNAKKIS